MARDRLCAIIALMALSGCGQAAEAPTASVGSEMRSPQTKGSLAAEIPAPRLPSDEQLASALDAEISQATANPPEGVIVEPDLLRTVVRNSRCRFLSERRTRAACIFETTRSVPDRSHVEAVEWVKRSRHWTRATRHFVYQRFSHNGVSVGEAWVALPR